MGETFTVKLSFKGKSTYVDEVSYEMTSVALLDEARKAFKIKDNVVLSLIFKGKTIAEEVVVNDDDIGCRNHPAFEEDMKIGRAGAKVTVKATKIQKRKKMPSDPNRFRDDGIWGHYAGELDAEGCRCGRGKIVWEDGNVYDGEWKDNKQDGFGVSWYPDGGKYEGEFKRGKRDGQGTYLHANGDKYKGDYKANLRDGRGTYRKRNGDVFVGSYAAGKKNGLGATQMGDGSLDVGLYKNGNEPVQGVRWSKDRRSAWLCKNGKIECEVGLSEARAMTAQMGFPESKINQAMEALTIA